MQQYYEILGISPGASQEEIKKAYRRLAKMYHPDVNNSLQASARFIKIHEAYNSLTGQQNLSVASNEQYWDDYDEEYEIRKKVWEYVKQQRKEKEEELQATMNKFFYYFNILLAAAFLFNLALIFDYLMPTETIEDKFVSVNWAGSNEKMHDIDAYLKSDGAITLKTADHHYEINVPPSIGLQIADDDTEITHTPLFKKVMSATAINFKNEKVLFHPAYSIYHGFIYLIPVMILVSFIYLFSKNENQNKITFSIILFFILVCQLYIFVTV